MTVSTESVCEMLTRDTATIAGKAVVTANTLVVLATADDAAVSDHVATGHNFLEHVSSEDVRAITDCITRANKQHEPQQTKPRVRLSADEWCIFELNMYPRDHFFEGSAPIFTGTNVTDDHFRNQRREVINRVLRHNLRNDMEVVIGNATIAREQCECGAMSPVTEITTISERLLSLGEKIRDIDARLNQSTFRFRRVNLHDVVDSVVEQFHAAHPAVTFRVNVGDHGIAGNSLVRDAVAELVENAIEHSGRAAADSVISITTEEVRERNEIKLRITDNGQGIPKGESDAISEATESKLNHSSGLGLWLVKWISDSVHATFEIGQRDGQRGTTAVLGFKHADRMDEADKQHFTDLDRKKIIRTELPDTGSTDIATSTRG